MIYVFSTQKVADRDKNDYGRQEYVGLGTSLEKCFVLRNEAVL